MNLLFFKWINRSFSAKVFICLLGAMTFIAATFSFFYLRFLQDNLETDMFKDGTMLTSILASNTRLGIFAENRKQISASLKSAVNIEGIVGACAYNLDGKLLHREVRQSWANTEICLKAENTAANFFKQLETSQEVLHLENETNIEFWRPVLAGSPEFTEESLYFETDGMAPAARTQLIGFVAAVLDKGPIQQSIREILWRNLLILAFFLLIGSIAAYYIVMAVTRPLKQLITNIKKTHGLETESQDELGILADTFSNMVQTLRNSFETINELKTGLEIKVAELEQEIKIRRNAEAALRESEDKFRSISEGIADGVAIIQDGKFTWLNRSFCKIFGYSSQELIGRPTEMLSAPGLQQSAEQTWDLLPAKISGAPYKFETLRKDGSRIVLDAKASEAFFAGAPAIELIIRNVTDREQAELEKKEMEIKALSQSKLASLGEIATGVAHEINQPLTYIKIAFQSTLRDMDNDQYDPGAMSNKFREALRQVERITAITEHLRSFGRNDISTFSPLNLPKAFDNTMILMGERIRLRNLTLIREIEDNLPQVYGNKMQLEQVFINLLQNSTDAMSDADTGKIRICMKRNGNFVETTIADTGPGIEAAITDKIFMPFFSTKKPEKGAGLGLAIATNIIKEHNGTIVYRQEPDWGATFIVSLPVMEDRE